MSQLQIIQNRKIFFALSGTLLVIAVISLVVWGLKLGLDFRGGSLMELEFKKERPKAQELGEKLKSFNLGNIVIQPAGEKGALLRFREIDEPTHQKILEKLKSEYKEVEEARFEAIGPVLGQELKRKAIIGIILALIAIVLYIAWAFRKVSKPVPSWKYGVVAVLALIHDVTIPTGIFSILGHFRGVEIDAYFITALLTILGFSVHDTIVVFDRTRENLLRYGSGGFEETVNKSVNQTLARSINTSLTTLLVLLALFIFGGRSIQYFVLALILGIVFGTYSSIFIASPLLVVWSRKK